MGGQRDREKEWRMGMKRTEKTIEAEGTSVVRSVQETSSKRPAEARKIATKLKRQSIDGRKIQMQDVEER